MKVVVAAFSQLSYSFLFHYQHLILQFRQAGRQKMRRNEKRWKGVERNSGGRDNIISWLMPDKRDRRRLTWKIGMRDWTEENKERKVGVGS